MRKNLFWPSDEPWKRRSGICQQTCEEPWWEGQKRAISRHPWYWGETINQRLHSQTSNGLEASVE